MANDVYKAIVTQAVADLQAWQRRHPGQEATVWAVPTWGNVAGQVIVADSVDPSFYRRGAYYMPRVIRPCDNRASTFQTWGSTPYSAQFGILYAALYREPILPPVPAKLEA